MNLRKSSFVAAAAVLATASSLFAAAITDGNVVFDSAGNNAPGGSGPGGVQFSVNGPLGANHISTTWWWYRIQGQTGQTALTMPTSDVTVGSIRLLTFDTPSFRFQLRYEVASAEAFTGAPTGSLTQRMTVTNKTSSALGISLFNYLDADLGGTAGNDVATVLSADTIALNDGLWIGDYQAGGVSAGYSVAPFGAPAVLGLNSGSNVNFANTGLPSLAGDVTLGYQFDTIASPGFARSVATTFNVTVIPEPSSAAALLAGLPLLARRRRA